jgi:hypothetical protein
VRRLRRLGGLAGGLILALTAAWALVNTPPPAEPVEGDHLTERDRRIVRESQRLRAAAGEAVWPGFGTTPLALQLYNDRFGFAIGAGAPAGWVEVEANRIDGEAYYRTAKAERQAFAVRIGDRWAGSLTVKEVMDAQLPRLLHEKIGPFARLIPYRLFIPSTDQYIALLLHEQFHAFEAEANPRRFARANAAYRTATDYPWEADGYRDAWREELRLLVSAIDAGDRASRADIMRRFLGKRAERRQRFLRDTALVEFERELEWLEGLAKYAELRSWQLGGQPAYTPLKEIQGDPQFHAYERYASQWQQERMSLRFSGNLRGDVPFYLSGALQAMVLDALDASWKDGFLGEDGPLEARLDRAMAR